MNILVPHDIEDGPQRKSVLELSSQEARKFFLKEESYNTLDLPPYLVFKDLLTAVDQELDGKTLSDLTSNPRDYDDINYTILNNKDGKYAWRPFQLIHPVLYVSLVHRLTEDDHWDLLIDRFKDFSKNKKIQCYSIPVVSFSQENDKAEQISQWWQEIEQKSIELSLEYEYLIETDVTDCYGAIYTHSIAWSLHSKPQAKKKRNDKKLLGNIIDKLIQDMLHGQTNGIPQGSVLMDFISEMVLGYADVLLTEKIAENQAVVDYRILRYRDDYKIFVNNPQDGDLILKLLTEIMIELGLKLNPNKTTSSNNIIRASVKLDKQSWLYRKQTGKSLQKHLLVIYDHANEYPNSGSLAIALGDYYRRLMRLDVLKEAPLPLISIAAEMAYRNPRVYSTCAAILSKLISAIKDPEEKRLVIEKIIQKFDKIPNTGHMQIWLQRITKPLLEDFTYEEPICQLVSGSTIQIWNNNWITSSTLRNKVDLSKIVDKKILAELKTVVPIEEVELFISKQLDQYK